MCVGSWEASWRFLIEGATHTNNFQRSLNSCDYILQVYFLISNWVIVYVGTTNHSSLLYATRIAVIYFALTEGDEEGAHCAK